MIAIGVFLAYRVSRLADHPPLGWTLLTLSFITALIRALCFIVAYSSPNSAQSGYTYAGQILGLPIVAFILSGVYFLYRDFTRQLKQHQSELIAPNQ
jgi:uncharacterized protein YneF (UPF0154 family)